MLTLASSGFALAIIKSEISKVIAAVLTFYVIDSAWLDGRWLAEWWAWCSPHPAV